MKGTRTRALLSLFTGFVAVIGLAFTLAPQANAAVDAGRKDAATAVTHQAWPYPTKVQTVTVPGAVTPGATFWSAWQTCPFNAFDYENVRVAYSVSGSTRQIYQLQFSGTEDIDLVVLSITGPNWSGKTNLNPARTGTVTLPTGNVPARSGASQWAIGLHRTSVIPLSTCASPYVSY